MTPGIQLESSTKIAKCQRTKPASSSIAWLGALAKVYSGRRTRWRTSARGRLGLVGTMAGRTTHRHGDYNTKLRPSWNFIAKKFQCTPAQCKARWEEILSHQATLNTDQPERPASPQADRAASGHQDDAPDPALPDAHLRASPSMADSHLADGPIPDPVPLLSSEAVPIHQHHADLPPDLATSPTPPSTSAPALDF